MNKLLLVSILAALVLAACGAQPAQLSGTSWVLSSLDGSTQVGSAAGGNEITLEFDAAGRAGGNGGCNGYGADYALGGNGSIEFGVPISTMMACEPALVMQNESAFLSALAEVTNFQIVGNTLTLTGGGHTLVFTR